MCRIFGFRSTLLSKVHTSLVSAENALMGQSKRHPDGWGLAYYIYDTPHLVKSTSSAETDELFKNISGIVTSQTVLAHIRKATHGKLSLINTHPFQYGRWTFAHNGNIRNFDSIKNDLKKMISPKISAYCLGDTDSEVFFFVILTFMMEKIDLSNPTPDLVTVMEQVKEANEALCKLIGPLTEKDKGIPTENYLTFVLTNGPLMIGMNGGMSLYYTTHKNRCPERETCKSFAPSCEALPEKNASVNHLIFSSEPLQGENVWIKMGPGSLVGISHEMKLSTLEATLPFLKDAA